MLDLGYRDSLVSLSAVEFKLVKLVIRNEVTKVNSLLDLEEVFIQVECHVYNNQRKLLEYCKSKDIVLFAYGALETQRYKEWLPPPTGRDNYKLEYRGKREPF
ncbi:aldo-keto reductase family 1 member C13-like protein [Cricetulus griseus]|uniref:Aldo-keto reductase family 1 member C13-like protein n=1 Tax=Cricetulus griseus TaxID=10029 RepID=A0A061I7S4_CRIGR|nr:aldo-keto reductase family 1 member C13-like protein [Cricetulus griseus]